MEESTKKPAPRSVTVPLPTDLQAIATAFDAVRDAVIAAIALGRTPGVASVDIVQRTLPPVLQGAMSLLADSGQARPMPSAEPALRPKREKHMRVKGANGLTGCELAILQAIALRHPRPTSDRQALAIAHYRPSGTTNSAIAALRAAGYVTGGGDAMRITQEGIERLPEGRPFVPTIRHERLRFWCKTLRNSCAEKMLQYLFDASYPDEGITIDTLLVATHYRPSGTTNSAIALLRLLELVDGARGGTLRVSSYLWNGT